MDRATGTVADAAGSYSDYSSGETNLSELRIDVAKAMVNHGLKIVSARPYENHLQMNDQDYEMAHASAGDFRIIHTRPQTGGSFELFDVFGTKGKLLAMRRESMLTDWTLVSMKRGDWESAFLLA